MPPPVFSSDASDESAETFREVEAVIQNLAFKFYRISIEKVREEMGGSHFPGEDEMDLTSIAWKKLSDRLVTDPEHYLRREGESEHAFHRRMVGLLIQIIKAVIIDAIRRAKARIPGAPPPPPSRVESPEYSRPSKPIEAIPWPDTSASQQRRKEIDEIVRHWGSDLSDGVRHLLACIVEAAPDRPSRQELRAELTKRLGGKTEVTDKDIEKWHQELKRKARKHPTLRALFYKL